MWGVLRIRHMFYSSTEKEIHNCKCTDWDSVYAYASYDYLSELTQPRYHMGLISMVARDDVHKSNTTLRTTVTTLWPSGICWWIARTLEPIVPISADTRLCPVLFSLSRRDWLICILHLSVDTLSFLLLCSVYVTWNRAVWVHAHGNTQDSFVWPNILL